jgi:hypothetical protein
MGIAEDFCVDFDNPAVWAVVHNISSIQLTFEKIAQAPDLNLVPRLLVDSSLLSENQITLITPSNPAIEISQALARISTKLGQMAAWRNTNIAMMTMAETLSEEPEGDLVVMGTLAQISAEFPELSNQMSPTLEIISLNSNPLTAEDGLVLFQASPFDPLSKALILTGEGLLAVEKSVMAATFDAFYEGATGEWAIIRSVPDLPKVPDADALSISLEDLGLEPQTAFGTREQTIQFNLPLSAVWDINTEAWLELHCSHSQLLNSDRSTLSVVLNEIPIASIPLTAATADEGFQKIRIPLRYFNVGVNTFNLRANMEHRDSREEYRNFCTDETYPRSWITIHPETAVVLPEIPKEMFLNLGSFPFGYADVSSFENFTFVIASESDDAALKTMVDLAVSMGKALGGHPSGISVRTIDQLNGNDLYQYHIMIGTSQNLLSAELNELLPIPLDLRTGILQPNQITLKIDTPSGDQGIIQAFQEAQGDIFLVLTGQSSSALLAGGNALADSEVRATLDGNLAIITTPDQAISYQLTPERDVVEQDTAPQLVEGQPLQLNGQSIWIVRISIGLVALSLVVLVAAIIWKNKNVGEA